MIWQHTKTDWLVAGVSATDMNRNEGNLQYLYNIGEQASIILNYVNSLYPSIESNVDLWHLFQFHTNITYVEQADLSWVIQEDMLSSEPIFTGLLKVTSTNSDSQVLIHDTKSFLMYDVAGYPIRENSFTGTEAQPYYLLVLFVSALNLAFPLYVTEQDYTFLSVLPLINNVPLINDLSTTDLGVTADNTPYNSHQTILQILEDMSEPDIGAIMLTARVLNATYILCDGAQYLQSDYPALYAIIGSQYGDADPGYFRVPSNNSIMHNSYIKALAELP